MGAGARPSEMWPGEDWPSSEGRPGLGHSTLEYPGIRWRRAVPAQPVRAKRGLRSCGLEPARRGASLASARGGWRQPGWAGKRGGTPFIGAGPRSGPAANLGSPERCGRAPYPKWHNTALCAKLRRAKRYFGERGKASPAPRSGTGERQQLGHNATIVPREGSRRLPVPDEGIRGGTGGKPAGSASRARRAPLPKSPLIERALRARQDS